LQPSRSGDFLGLIHCIWHPSFLEQIINKLHCTR
jgi:hypothetical protein